MKGITHCYDDRPPTCPARFILPWSPAVLTSTTHHSHPPTIPRIQPRDYRLYSEDSLPSTFYHNGIISKKTFGQLSLQCHCRVLRDVSYTVTMCRCIGSRGCRGGMVYMALRQPLQCPLQTSLPPLWHPRQIQIYRAGNRFSHWWYSSSPVRGDHSFSS